MSIARVPVDFFNPGQVFACLGLMEMTEVLLGAAEGAFVWGVAGSTQFALRGAGDGDPVAACLEFLSKAELYSIAPPDEDLSTAKWDVRSRTSDDGSYPIPVPASPATLPAVLTDGERRIVIASWGETSSREVLGTGRDNVKFWAGAGGYPGVGLLRDAIELVRPQLQGAATDPFALTAPQTSSLRLDWRRDYIPIDIGFSLNEHTKIRPRGYPLVEILAVIGLCHARPQRVRKLEYRYSVVGSGDERDDIASILLPPPLMRAGMGCAALPFPTRTFTMHLDWPGQENQARCITTVHEESTTP